MAPFGHGRPQIGGGKPQKTDFKSLLKLAKYCKPFIPSIVTALVLAVLSAIASIVGPDKISELMNVITAGVASISGIDMTAFMDVVVFLICLYALGAVASYVQQFLMAGVTAKVTKNLRHDVSAKINKLPLSYFDKIARGDLLSVMTNDIDVIAQTLGSTIANLASSVTLFVGVLVMMFVVNWVLALVTIASSVLGFVLMFLILGKSQKYFHLRQQNLAELGGHIEEIYTNHSVVKSYGAAYNETQKFSKINHNLFANNWKSQSLSGLMHPLMGFAGNISYVAIFVVGIALILSGSSAVSFGTIISFTIYARLFSQPLSSIAQAMSSIQQASAASARVFDMLGEKEISDEKEKVAKITDIKGNVEFKNVKFGYNPNELVIKDFTASVKAGSKVAIVGPTGAGKTTLVNLLMRFYELDSGDIFVDGVSIKDMKREDVREMFDMILQDTWLFDGTIRENLVYNKTGVTDEMLGEVCSAVGLSHFIATLEHGYDTVLDSGLGLSEGQKQQLTLARAMIKNSPMLILDEATSSVDTRTELVIQNAMDKLTHGRTSFVIAHRLSTIKNADLILVLRDGDIKEQGTHDELLAKNGFYAELYNSQFQDVES